MFGIRILLFAQGLDCRTWETYKPSSFISLSKQAKTRSMRHNRFVVGSNGLLDMIRYHDVAAVWPFKIVIRWLYLLALPHSSLIIRAKLLDIRTGQETQRILPSCVRLINMPLLLSQRDATSESNGIEPVWMTVAILLPILLSAFLLWFCYRCHRADEEFMVGRVPSCNPPIFPENNRKH